jgi:thioredoxin-dependent peroxiredoxin
MLQVGDRAPDFDLMSDTSKQIRLKDLKGQTVVLYFYPKDDTPGCTKEACAFRDDYAKFSKKGVLLGVSLDDVKAHQKFKNKYSLPFPLLADQSATTSKAYGVYKKKSMYGRSFWGIERSTFIIGPDGKIRAIFPRVKVDGHHLEVLEALS